MSRSFRDVYDELVRVCHCLIVSGEDIARSHAASSSDKIYFVLTKVCLVHSRMCLDFHDYPINKNHGEKVKINSNLNAADGRRLASSRQKRDQSASSLVFDVICNALWVK